jgi:hypothetical protein
VRRRGRKILESKFKLITLFSHTHRDSPSLANNSTQWWPPRSTTPPLPSTILSFPFSGSTLLYLYSPLTHIFNNFTFSSIFSFQVNQKIPRRFHAQSHQVTLRLHLQIQGQPPLPKWFQISQDLVPICNFISTSIITIIFEQLYFHLYIPVVLRFQHIWVIVFQVLHSHSIIIRYFTTSLHFC